MKITFLWLGKCKDKSFQKIIDEYSKRLSHYNKHKITEIKEPRNKSKDHLLILKKEATLILSNLNQNDFVILLDERGKHLSSIELSNYIQHKMNISIHQLVIIIAGAYGAHQSLKDRADFTLSLSELTLTHDMARIFILEQIYRVFTILKGEKYHKEC